MTSPLETKARALAEKLADEAMEKWGETWVLSTEKATPLLLDYAAEVEREAVARCERIAVAHANRWLNEPLRSDARADACMGVARAIAGEPPAETPEPKG